MGSYTATLTVTDNGGATGSTSIVIAATTDTNAIAAPSNLSGPVARSGAVTLSWTDNSSNETGFYVERAPSGTTSFARVGQVAANVTKYSESPGPGRYVYRVQAFNSSTGRGIGILESSYRSGEMTRKRRLVGAARAPLH